MDLLDVLGFFHQLERWMDTLASLAPFLMFVAAIIIGNLGDKKKPKVKKSKPFPQNAPLPDIKRPAEVTVDIKPIPQPRMRPPEHRPHHPAEYEEVHNPYQRYLEDEGSRQAAEKAGQAGKQDKVQKKQRVADTPKRESRLANVMNVSLVQAIVSAEVLGRPKALQRRRR